jgi:hypothetical protein
MMCSYGVPVYVILVYVYRYGVPVDRSIGQQSKQQQSKQKHSKLLLLSNFYNSIQKENAIENNNQQQDQQQHLNDSTNLLSTDISIQPAKCLHTHVAHYISNGCTGNIIGQWVMEELEHHL